MRHLSAPRWPSKTCSCRPVAGVPPAGSITRWSRIIFFSLIVLASEAARGPGLLGRDLLAGDSTGHVTSQPQRKLQQASSLSLGGNQYFLSVVATPWGGAAAVCQANGGAALAGYSTASDQEAVLTLCKAAGGISCWVQESPINGLCTSIYSPTAAVINDDCGFLRYFVCRRNNGTSSNSSPPTPVSSPPISSPAPGASPDAPTPPPSSTSSPTASPTTSPTSSPTTSPTASPTSSPTPSPSRSPPSSTSQPPAPAQPPPRGPGAPVMPGTSPTARPPPSPPKAPASPTTSSPARTSPSPSPTTASPSPSPSPAPSPSSTSPTQPPAASPSPTKTSSPSPASTEAASPYSLVTLNEAEDTTSIMGLAVGLSLGAAALLAIVITTLWCVSRSRKRKRYTLAVPPWWLLRDTDRVSPSKPATIPEHGTI